MQAGYEIILSALRIKAADFRLIENNFPRRTHTQPSTIIIVNQLTVFYKMGKIVPKCL